MQERDFLDDLFEYDRYALIINVLINECHSYHIKTNELLENKPSNILKKIIVKSIVNSDIFNEIFENKNNKYELRKNVKESIDKVNSKVLVRTKN